MEKDHTDDSDANLFYRDKRTDSEKRNRKISLDSRRMRNFMIFNSKNDSKFNASGYVSH